jgi:predicted RND superfamily exporter protein
VSITGDGPDSLQSLAAVREIKQLQQWLEKLPQVDRTYSMADLVEEMHWAMNGEKPGFRSLPPTARLLRQYLLVYDGRDMFELVDRDFQRARIVLSLNVHGARDIGAVIQQIREHVRQQPSENNLKVDIGGYGRLFADQSDLLISGQTNSFVGAFLQIFVFMLLLWRSFTMSAICMVPNLAPLYFVFVAMGTLGIHIDTATVMIAGLVLGITVDDTVHIFHSYRHRLKAGMDPVWAIARSFESIGPAVLAISVLLVCQFLLLTASSFIPTANFGLMTAIGLLSGQVFELLLLPALLVLSNRRRKPRLPDPIASGQVSTRSGATSETGER